MQKIITAAAATLMVHHHELNLVNELIGDFWVSMVKYTDSEKQFGGKEVGGKPVLCAASP